MAFDLLKLQILQEALEAQKLILRTQVDLLENHNEKAAQICLCRSLY